jgi:hypothetical protein
VDPVYVTQTTIAGLYYIKNITVQRFPKQKRDYWFSKYNRVLHHYSVNIAADAATAALCYRK